MRVAKYMQDKNPSQQQIEREYNRIESIDRQIDELQREQRKYENWLRDLETSQFVVCGKDETFWDHLCQVEYTGGYYQTIDDAAKDGAAEYPQGFKVYNLLGEEQAVNTNPDVQL